MTAYSPLLFATQSQVPNNAVTGEVGSSTTDARLDEKRDRRRLVLFRVAGYAPTIPQETLRPFN
jgi:hypothetical protein